MNEQPEALLVLADRIDEAQGKPIAIDMQAAAELRRLRQVNAELLEALKEIRPVIIFQRDIIEGNKNPSAWSWPIGVIDAAIAKAEGEKA